MSIYICPKCHEPLESDESGRSLVCPAHHCYDLSASGYVNLLLPEQMNTKLPGDNKLMVNARRAFLEKGYYSNLREALCDTAVKYYDGGAVFDAGCGEGYYSAAVADRLGAQNGENFFFGGTDISKNAVNAASKRFYSMRERTLLCVSSVFHLPVKTCSCSLLTTLFAPYCGEEYSRILQKDGIMLMVIPSRRHLYGLKAAVYDNPYLNEVRDYALDGFKLCERLLIESEITLDKSEDIQNLFTMTPYYYKTGVKEQARLNALETLTTETGFELLVYQKQ